MAVLPTPGSPMSTGLFLVRRLSTWMTRRISSSRPMTGSSLPFAARPRSGRRRTSPAPGRCPRGWARSRAGCRARPASAPSSASWPAPASSSRRWASPPASAAASSRCSVETYSSPRRLASSSACLMRVVTRGSRPSWPPSILARRESTAATSTATAAGSAPSWRSVITGCPRGLRAAPRGGARRRARGLGGAGQLLCGEDGLLGFLGVAIELHGSGFLSVQRVRAAARAAGRSVRCGR